MEKRVHFNTAIEITAGSEQSQRHDALLGESRSGEKRKIDSIAKRKQSQTDPKKEEISRKRRKVSVYDAVSGRAGKNGFLPSEPIYSKNRVTASSSTQPVAPDDILFDRKGARVRFAEEGDYVGVDDLGPIPPSELLETLHRYVSRFYDRPDIERKHLHYKSMDGTALLALGILLEETLEQSLGDTGHLAFLTAEDEESLIPPLGWDGHAWVKKIQRREESVDGPSGPIDIDCSPEDEISESEAGDNTDSSESEDHVDEDELYQKAKRSSSTRDLDTPKERTQNPHNIQFSTNAQKDAPNLLISSNADNVENSAPGGADPRTENHRSSRNTHQSTSMVKSNDENDEEGSVSDGDIEMGDFDGVETHNDGGIDITYTPSPERVCNSWKYLADDVELDDPNQNESQFTSNEDSDLETDESEDEVQSRTKHPSGGSTNDDSGVNKAQLAAFSLQPLTDSSSSSDSDEESSGMHPNKIVENEASQSRLLKSRRPSNSEPFRQGSKACSSRPVEELGVISDESEESVTSGDSGSELGTAIRAHEHGPSGHPGGHFDAYTEEGDGKDSEREGDEADDEGEPDDEEKADDKEEEEGGKLDSSGKSGKQQTKAKEKDATSLPPKAPPEGLKDKRAKFFDDMNALLERLLSQ